MPLPTTIGFLDADGVDRKVEVKAPKKESGYAPDVDYHPTMVPVKCRTCRSVGIAEFVNGFDLADGDKLMSGRPIRGICFRCARETELVPIKIDNPEKDGHLRHLYNIRKALEEAARRGESVDSSGVVWPLERIKAYERYRQSAGDQDGA